MRNIDNFRFVLKQLYDTSALQLLNIFRAFYTNLFRYEREKNKTIRRRFKTYPLRPADAIEDQRQVGNFKAIGLHPIDVTYS